MVKLAIVLIKSVWTVAPGVGPPEPTATEAAVTVPAPVMVLVAAVDAALIAVMAPVTVKVTPVLTLKVPAVLVERKFTAPTVALPVTVTV